MPESTTAARRKADRMPTSVELLELTEALNHAKPIARATHLGLHLALRHHGDSLWLTVARGKDGGAALRLPLFAPGSEVSLGEPGDEGLLTLTATNEIGRFTARLEAADEAIEHVRWTVRLKPARDIHLPYIPRDLMVFGSDGDPQATAGKVEAAQRRMNTGLLYLRAQQPNLGKLLYVQDFTELNAYFAATGTKPDAAVGGAWPLLGYLPPSEPGNPATALRGGREITLYATHLVFRAKPEEEERESAWQFLDMLAWVSRQVDSPKTLRRDWIGRSDRTLADLCTSPKLRQEHYGHTYFHPYTSAEYPDSMVQLAILTGVREWARWRGEVHPLEQEIAAGMERFYDPKLKTLRRYLPDVGADKNADAVDSWYLYHPLLNLGKLALAGEDWARDLFLRSVDYGVKAARHFQYRWPIMYDVKDFSIITAVTEADRRGQTDVGGIYAWVMLQAFQLTDDPTYLHEAKTAIKAAEGMRFDLNYQANLTAWGAAACMRLWRITDDKSYLAQSYVYLASFFHNCQMWESEIGFASQYNNFMAVTCLQDAPYMAMYECYDSFAAFEHYLDLGGPDLIPSVRFLLTDYCRHALHRAWWYYPDTLPPEAIATKPRNGEVDRELSLPMEDLYPDGQQAGQVGQETYAAGAAMVFATRSYHRISGAPFVLFCDHFLRALTRIDNGTLSAVLDGVADTTAEFAVVRSGRGKLPAVVLRDRRGKIIRPARSDDDEICWSLSAGAALTLSW